MGQMRCDKNPTRNLGDQVPKPKRWPFATAEATPTSEWQWPIRKLRPPSQDRRPTWFPATKNRNEIPRSRPCGGFSSPVAHRRPMQGISPAGDVPCPDPPASAHSPPRMRLCALPWPHWQVFLHLVSASCSVHSGNYGVDIVLIFIVPGPSS